MTTSYSVAAAVVLLLLMLLSSSQGIGAKCSKSDITVVQSQAPPKYNGIPTYKVEILNRSPNGISISDIHVNCGWFSSADLINPNTFKRLKYNDCLVNGGRPLRAGYALSSPTPLPSNTLSLFPPFNADHKPNPKDFDLSGTYIQ